MAVATLFLIFFFFLFHQQAYSRCPPSFYCINLNGVIEFPLTIHTQPDCGLFTVDCSSETPTIQFVSGGKTYVILENTSSNSFKIYDSDLQGQLERRECSSFVNLPFSPSCSLTTSSNLTFFKCMNESSSDRVNQYFQSYQPVSCALSTGFYRESTDGLSSSDGLTVPPSCTKIELPRNSSRDMGDLFELVTAEYTVEWNVYDNCTSCYHNGGQCSTNGNNQFVCIQLRGGNNHGTLTLAVGSTAATAFILGMFITIGLKYRWKNICKHEAGNEKNIELFLKSQENLAQKRYSYKKIKKITSSFSCKLGKGGYGTVYRGKLDDGRLVAVKILNESKGDGEDFMNEVASISRTSHVNVVSLLGFCFNGRKRALVYEFMPNGSLDKFLFDSSFSSGEARIWWEKLFEIAVGIARGLEYLHQGCNTRILHLDIKPQNILLDKDLKPKIADFGLAKLCPNRASIVSMVVARGTIGYIAPEVFCRTFGDVSYKSDVYSYGMMVLDMVGMRNFDPKVDGTSEVYFPHNIYKDLEIGIENGDLEKGENEDESQYSKRKLTIIGLWCVQTDPRNRPSMSNVLEMLEGKNDTLQVPPKPQSTSPTRFASRDFSNSRSIYSYE